MKQYLFELLQVAIGNRTELTACPTDEEWVALFEMSKRQQVVGVAYAALLALPPHQQLEDMVLLLRWHKLAMKVERRNEELSVLSERAVSNMLKEGFDCMLLKGHSLLAFYPERIRKDRTSGDIDLWVRKPGMRLSADNEVYRYVRSHCGQQLKSGYIHIGFPVFEGTEIEAHIRPCYLANPWHNHRLQQWFEGLDIRTLNDDPAARLAFNRLFLLVHLYKHFIHEGATVRQLMDYYLVLKADVSPVDEAMLRRCGVWQFYLDIMPLMEHVFEGKAIPAGRSSWLLDQVMSPIDKSRGLWQRFGRLARLLRYYPDEVVCVPFFAMYNRLCWDRRGKD